MKIIVAGGTGFLGRHLCRALGEAGHEVVVLSRSEGRPPLGAARRLAWGGRWPAELEGAGAVVNLSGAGIADGRWTERQKRRILDSRTQATRSLVEQLSKARLKPGVLVNASAIGFYGDRGAERLTEASAPGSGFLARVCVSWEEEAARAKECGVRVAMPRFGIILGADGGALMRMLPPFKLGLGGPLGSGAQFMSWIHVDDAVGLIRFAMERREVEGPLNAVAPAPVSNRDFSRALAAALGRPCWLAAPAFVLRVALGEMSELLLASQRVEPAAALDKGYRFQHPELGPALSQLLRR